MEELSDDKETGPPLDPALLCRHFHYHKPFFLHPFVSSVSLWVNQSPSVTSATTSEISPR